MPSENSSRGVVGVLAHPATSRITDKGVKSIATLAVILTQVLPPISPPPFCCQSLASSVLTRAVPVERCRYSGQLPALHLTHCLDKAFPVAVLVSASGPLLLLRGTRVWPTQFVGP